MASPGGDRADRSRNAVDVRTMVDRPLVAETNNEIDKRMFVVRARAQGVTLTRAQGVPPLNNRADEVDRPGSVGIDERPPIVTHRADVIDRTDVEALAARRRAGDIRILDFTHATDARRNAPASRYHRGHRQDIWGAEIQADPEAQCRVKADSIGVDPKPICETEAHHVPVDIRIQTTGEADIRRRAMDPEKQTIGEVEVVVETNVDPDI